MRIVLDAGVPETALNIAAAEISDPAAFDAFVSEVLAAGGALWPGQVIALTAAAADGGADGDEDASDLPEASAADAAPLRQPRPNTIMSAVVTSTLAGMTPAAIAANLGVGWTTSKVCSRLISARRRGYLPAREGRA